MDNNIIGLTTLAAAVAADNQPIPARELKDIEGVLHRLPLTNPVRLAVVRFLLNRLARDRARAEAVKEEAAILCKMLAAPGCRRWQERLVAAWALGWLPENEALHEQAIAVLVPVLKERGNADVWDRFCLAAKRTWYASMSLTFLLCGILVCCSPHEWQKILDQSLGGLLVVSFILLIAPGLVVNGLVEDRRLTQVRVASATALGRLRAPQGAGALAAACRDRAEPVREAAVEALPAVLSGLTPAHCGCLDGQAVPNLWRLLDTSEATLTLQILEALGKVGDGRSVEPVERLLVDQFNTAIRAAAEAVLPILQERRRHERETGSLLRPSVAPEEPSATLLRPAQGASEVDLQALLRAASVEPNETD